MRHNINIKEEKEAVSQAHTYVHHIDSLPTAIKTAPSSASKTQQDYWQQCKEHLQKQIPTSLYENIIAPLKANPSTSFSTSSKTIGLELVAPNQELAARVSQRYLPMIKKLLISTPMHGQVSIQTAKHQYPTKTTDPKSITRKGNNTKAKQLDFSSQNFHVPQVNDAQIKKLYQDNTIFSYIWGKEGSGKTTIGLNIAQHKESLGLRTRYLTFENFITELAIASRRRDSMDWRNKLRSYDCLIIDDFQHIKPQARRSQEELLYIIDEFTQKQKFLVFCADRPVIEIQLIASLLSRLQSAQTIRLSYPDEKERQRILKNEAKNQDLSLKKETIDYLSRSICRDMRRLKTSIYRLKEENYNSTLASSKAMTKEASKNNTIDLRFVDKLCQDLYTYQSEITAHDILITIAKFYGVTTTAITGPSRDKKYALARHLVAYLCTKHLNMSLKETAQFIGRRDHASIIHARNKIAKMLEEDLFFRQQIHELLVNIQH